jgi:hypothetical protein
MATSRYDGVETATVTISDGVGTREVRYWRRRELPDPRATRVVAVHRVSAGDRLDLVSATYLGDPEAAWQIADANTALDPAELTAPEAQGDLVVIPMPGGAP